MTWYQKANNVREIFSLYVVKEPSYVAVTAYQPEKHIIEIFFEKNLHTDFLTGSCIMKFHGRTIDEKFHHGYLESASGITIKKGIGISPDNLLMLLNEQFDQLNLVVASPEPV